MALMVYSANAWVGISMAKMQAYLPVGCVLPGCKCYRRVQAFYSVFSFVDFCSLALTCSVQVASLSAARIASARVLLQVRRLSF